MTSKVIQGFFPGGQPKLASVQPRIAAPPPIQAKTAAPAPVTAVAGRPPGPPIPAFGAQPSGPPAPASGLRPGAVQRHGAGGAFAVDSGALGLASGGGKPLPEAVRGQMEAALGADFSNVRVHVGPQAERIGAIAFTVGSDIYFAPGRYQPDTVHGQQLLGHELAHVVQQRAGRVRNPLGSGLAVVQDHALEAEADRLGQRAAAHGRTLQTSMAGGAMKISSVAKTISHFNTSHRVAPAVLDCPPSAIATQTGPLRRNTIMRQTWREKAVADCSPIIEKLRIKRDFQDGSKGVTFGHVFSFTVWLDGAYELKWCERTNIPYLSNWQPGEWLDVYDRVGRTSDVFEGWNPGDGYDSYDFVDSPATVLEPNKSRYLEFDIRLKGANDQWIRIRARQELAVNEKGETRNDIKTWNFAFTQLATSAGVF